MRPNNVEFLATRDLSALRKALLTALLCLTIASAMVAQEPSVNRHSLNIPFRKYGISLGNSSCFNGLRLNLADKNTQRINGINFSLFYASKNQNKEINGVSMGLIPSAQVQRGICLGALGLDAKHAITGIGAGSIIASDHFNGLALCGLATTNEFKGVGIGGIGMITKSDMKGIGLGGLFLGTNKISGVVASGLMILADSVSGISLSSFNIAQSLRGINIGAIGVATPYGRAKGLTIAGAAIYQHRNYQFIQLKGVSIAGLLINSNNIIGLASACYVNSTSTNGVTIALFNRTRQLHGVQIGLVNYAANNKGIFKLLPLVNLSFRKHHKMAPSSPQKSQPKYNPFAVLTAN